MCWHHSHRVERIANHLKYTYHDEGTVRNLELHFNIAHGHGQRSSCSGQSLVHSLHGAGFHNGRSEWRCSASTAVIRSLVVAHDFGRSGPRRGTMSRHLDADRFGHENKRHLMSGLQVVSACVFAVVQTEVFEDHISVELVLFDQLHAAGFVRRRRALCTQWHNEHKIRCRCSYTHV